MGFLAAETKFNGNFSLLRYMLLINQYVSRCFHISCCLHVTYQKTINFMLNLTHVYSGEQGLLETFLDATHVNLGDNTCSPELAVYIQGCKNSHTVKVCLKQSFKYCLQAEKLAGHL